MDTKIHEMVIKKHSENTYSLDLNFYAIHIGLYYHIIYNQFIEMNQNQLIKFLYYMIETDCMIHHKSYFSLRLKESDTIFFNPYNYNTIKEKYNIPLICKNSQYNINSK